MPRFLEIVLLVLGAAAVQGNKCSYECVHTETVNGSSYSWDLSGLCTDEDRVISDSQGHTYKYQVCDTAVSGCYPDWTPAASHGVAIQYWGAVAQGPCYTPGGDGHACTQQCEVLGYGDPIDWSPIEEGGAVTGISYTHNVVAESPDDQHICDIDIVTGQPFKRQIRYEFRCDASVTFAQDSAVQDPNNDCHYTLKLRSCKACQGGCPTTPGNPSHISGGSVFLIVFFVLLSIYLIAGVVFSKITTAEWTHPHAEMWVAFGGLVAEGGRFTVATLTGQRSSSKYADMDSGAAPAASGGVGSSANAGSGFQGSSGAGGGEFADL